MTSPQSTDLGIDGRSSAGRQLVATYATYDEAQRAVDQLSDAGFPVESVDIVGRDLSLVEHFASTRGLTAGRYEPWSPTRRPRRRGSRNMRSTS